MGRSVSYCLFVNCIPEGEIEPAISDVIGIRRNHYTSRRLNSTKWTTVFEMIPTGPHGKACKEETGLNRVILEVEHFGHPISTWFYHRAQDAIKIRLPSESLNISSFTAIYSKASDLIWVDLGWTGLHAG